MKMNAQISLAQRPVGRVRPEDFAFHEAPVGTIGDGQVLVEVQYLSLDPANRGWINEADTYLPAVKLGEVMRGYAAGVVLESKDPQVQPGQVVTGLLGWQRYAIVDAKTVRVIPPALAADIPATLSIFGATGLTAYFGLLDVAKPKANETVVVSAAAGAVGSIVGQIAKIYGCRVVGIAGGPEKCERLISRYGYDAAIDYKAGSVTAQLRAACPDGIDVYFDNVGGEILDVVLSQINIGARISVCGAIASYNDVSRSHPIYNHVKLVMKRATMQGFLVFDYNARTEEGVSALSSWVRDGLIKYDVDVIDGLENAPMALNRLFDGTNQGKLLIKL